MRRLVTAACAALVLAGLLATAVAGAPKAPRLTEIAGAKFPERSFLLTLPEDRTLTAEQIKVTENGKAVSGATIEPAAASEERRFGTVLAIDASNSMRGRPIEAAMEAARAFASRRNDNQELAIIMFNSTTNLVLPFTDDAAAIDDALATSPTLANGTLMYDAVDEAVALIEDAELASASVVLLSDGRDSGSTTISSNAIASAREANIRVFSVGLRSKHFDPSALRAVGDGSGGTFTAASSPDQLQLIFDALGAQLAGEYILRYRSLAGPGAEVEVVARVDGFGGRASSGYRTPELPKKAASPTFERDAVESFWRSPWATLLAALASSLFLALAVAALLGRRRPGLVSRISAFVSVAPDEDKTPRTSLGETLFGGTEKSLERWTWWTRFQEDVEIGKIRLRPGHIVLLALVGTALVVSILYTVNGIFAVLGLGFPLAVRAIVKRKANRQRSLFADQLPDNLQVLGSALRAGHSFVGALSVVVDDAGEPSASEFKRVVADERLGVPLEDALDVVARRMQNRDLEQVSLVAALQRLSGGNSAEVLDRVAETVRERGQIRRLVKALTAQGRMARWIVSLLPVALLVFLTLMNREYMAPLFTEPLGRMALVFAAVLVFTGSVLIKRIIDIKV
ncbi:MAG: VWA domain-containing protein [Actinomycetota bacterium]|nr:VWA domain-containing protein [Actinomycetota bacterium]